MGTNKRSIGTRTQLSAFGADLGSEIRSNSDNFNTFSFSLILDKTLQLIKTPVTNPIVHSSSSSHFSYSFEVFHNNLISIEIGNDCLTYVMIYPLHKTVFSSRQLLEKSFAGTSAFALKFGTQIFEFSFNLFDFTTVEKFIIRSDCKVVYSEINAKNSILEVRALSIDFFGKTKQKETSSFSIHSQKTFSDVPSIEILFITFWNNNIKLLPSFDCKYAQNIIFERSTPVKIIPHTAMINNWFRLCSFNHTAGLLDTNNSQLTWESSFTQGFINEWMKFYIITDSPFPSLIDTELQTLTINFDGSDYFIGCSNLDFGYGSNFHSFDKYSDFINLMEGSFPPNPEGMGIQTAQVI